MNNQINRNISLNQLRSYSTIFSSSSFSKLLKQDDYSFIDAKIKRYDVLKVGSSIVTYYDYIKYIYKLLRKKYRNEYVFKNTLINELLIKNYGVKDTVFINEFRVGNSIADMVMFNGSSKAFEIKTELDSNKRLFNQLEDYKKIFNECYVVVHESQIEKYIANDVSIGIIALFENPRSLKIQEIKKATVNKNIDSDTLIHSIRTSEYKNIIKRYFGELPEMNSFNMFDICKRLFREIPNDKLNKLFIEELKNRKSNTQNISLYHKELRQIALSMNINDKNYNQLKSKLEQPISI
jgi:hypothetical protein